MLLTLVLLLDLALVRAQAPLVRPAVPLDPIAAILDAFKTHSLVALGEGGHGNEQGHRFRLALVRDPRFAANVDDIVVESGTARYQGVMDRFVRGDAVPMDEVRHAWQDTTQPSPLWDIPIYEEFFQAVRAVNVSRPRGKQIRVLLGDPPVDWDAIRTIQDIDKLGSRDSHAAGVIRREVLARKHRALMIYGDEHFGRKSRSLTGDDWASNMVGELEKAGEASVFVIHTETRTDLSTLQPDVKSWPVPSLTLVRGTTIGAAPYEPAPRLRTRLMEELFDAVLYLGPPSNITFAELGPARCRDAAYMEMRLERLALLPGPPPQAPAGTLGPLDRFKQYCASIAK